MFWGLIVEPGKSYKQTVEKSFHVSMACLQPDKCKDTGYLSFILRTVGQEFVLCNLQKGSTNQVQLDLNFNAGDEIAFTTSGAKNTVHLSGYLITDEEMDGEMFDESDSEIDVADLRELNKKRKNMLERAGSGKVPKLETADDDDDDEDNEDDDDSDSDDDDSNAMEKLEAIEEGEEDSDEEFETDEDEDEQAEQEVKTETKSKGNKTPTAPTTPATPAAQTNGNGPASGKKNKKNKEALKNNANNVNNANTPNAQKSPKTPAAGTPSKKTLEGGVMVEDLKVGNGPQAKSGQMVKVYYTGRLKSNNKQFDANNSGKPFGFRLGRGEVIKGWDIGVCGMQLGGKRKITIPAALAYGSKGAPPSIPPNSVLVFDVEMKGLH